MQINISYEPTSKELAHVSVLYTEKKPLMRIIASVINAFSYLILALILFKIVRIGSLLPDEILAGVGAIGWLFGRGPFIRQIFEFRMKRSPLINTTLLINISLNGIAWSGKRIQTGSMKWNEINAIIEIKEGFILPCSVFQFLWLPFRGFASAEEIETFRQAVLERKIKIQFQS